LRIIDLTTELSLGVFARDTHAGTHIEAPAYLFTDGKKIDQFGLESFILQAVLLDLTHKEPGQPIDDEDLEAAEERAGLALREGEAVILHTGCCTSADNTSVYKNHSYLSENGAEFLEFKRLSLVGTNAPNLDPHDRGGFPAHAILMRAEILVLENLCNLESIDQVRFRLVALPLKLRASTSPVRAAAILDDWG
jgi:kynurenine formamidase